LKTGVIGEPDGRHPIINGILRDTFNAQLTLNIADERKLVQGVCPHTIESEVRGVDKPLAKIVGQAQAHVLSSQILFRQKTGKRLACL
jgi:hypothetical protein